MNLDFKKYAKKISEIIDGDMRWTIGEGIIYCKSSSGEIKISEKMIDGIVIKINDRLNNLTKVLKQKNIDSKIKRDCNREAKELRRFILFVKQSQVSGHTIVNEDEDEEL